MREHVPRAPSLGPPLGWAPLRAQSSPPRLSCSNSLRHAEELVTELRRALMDLHGTKSLSIRHLLETSITSVLATRSQDQRIGRREDGPGAPARERERAFVQVECGVGALELH